jgi:two-component system response regulator AtoC
MDQPEIERIGDELYFVAASPATRRLRTQAEQLAQTEVPVLITGEAGSGRATVARLIHLLSLRSSFQFVRVNCRALAPELLENELFGSEYVGANGSQESNPGKFEQCGRGTVLLDGINTMTDRDQDRLLRLLQTREFVRCGGHTPVRVDVRIMATMDGELDTTATSEGPNAELYHRLSVFQLRVPPLRERREEIPLLFGQFMSRLTRRYGVPAPHFSNELLDACQHYSWPGNLRELENFVKRFLAQGDEHAALEELQGQASLQGWYRKENGNKENGNNEVTHNHNGGSEKTSLKLLARNAKGEAERHAIQQALEETHWNRKAAARLLDISYRGLLYKIQEYGLVPPNGNGVSYSEAVFRPAK